MKKTNFFKLLMVGAAALSLGLAGCNNVSEKDFEKACDRISALETSVTDLTTRLNAVEQGNYVTNVTKVNASTIRVSYKTGDPVDIVLGVEGPGELVNVTIGENGNWYIGGEDTGYSVFGPAPKVVNNVWQFPTLKDGEIVWEAGSPAILNAYATLANGVWTLYIPDSAKPGEFAAIKLPSASSGLGKIDIIGWITGKGLASEKISRDNALYNGANGVNNQTTAQFDVNYAWIKNFRIDTDNTAAQSAQTLALGQWMNGNNKITTWEAMTTVKELNVINTLVPERKGILIQVHPTTVQVEDIEFTLESSAAGVAPLKMAKPELVTGLLTRAAANSALWFIPWTYENSDVTFPATVNGAAQATPVNAAYEAKYETNALYSLVTEDGLRSEYSHFTIVPNGVLSYEAAFEGVVNNNELTVSSTLNIPSGTVNVYKVIANKEYTLDFNVIDMVPDVNAAVDNTIKSTDAVVDYRMEVLDNNAYINDNFNITINDKAGTIKVAILPDALTLATFKLRVYKLGVDGAVYIEDVNIYPVRDIQGAVIREGKYLVVDSDKKAGGLTVSDKDVSSLDPMFAQIATIPSGQSMTLKERWQNSTYGAKAWRFTNITIDGKPLNGNTATGYKYPGLNFYPTIGDFTDIYLNSGGVFGFTEKANDAFITNAHALDAAKILGEVYVPRTNIAEDQDLYKARFFAFRPPYAFDNGYATFEIGKEYVFDIEFLDEQDNYISSATVKLTPAIPALADFFHKEAIYWNDDLTVLEARYKVPTTTAWAPNWYYDADDDNVADAGERPFSPSLATATTVNGGAAWHATSTSGATFYNVYSTSAVNGRHNPNSPFDGGFDKFGDDQASGKQWIAAGTTLDFIRNAQGAVVQKINNNTVDNYVAIGGPINAAAITTPATAATTFDFVSGLALKNQTNGTTGNGHDYGYNTPINLTVRPGKYLDKYEWTDEAELAKLNFDVKISSALAEGGVKGLDAGGSIQVVYASTGNNIAKITDEDVEGYNYNNVPYSLFPTYTNVAGAPTTIAYEYRYIKSVEFFVPSGVGTPYYFLELNAAGTGYDQVVGTVGKVIMPDWALDAAMPVPHVAIEPNNLEQVIDTKIGVRVIDRYGRTRESEVPLKIVKQ